ncbi:pseudoazurin [Breoghania sp. L-A4]|uniref:pseudoazurin n=1 Tax=Breoghania sp. L-A4 TaxID=2304600 RepID=UPI000E35C067|nr:pseudoazurin [Breoghania sp. L-A4]AXS41596.1 pseudoazurin [Breoghania sp. L-A4]
MLSRTLAVAAALALMTGVAFAETHEVQMLNKGEAGSMVFEPAYVAAQPGDTIHFVSVDKGHNVEGIKDMLPDGVAAFKSKMSKDFELTVDTEGLYGLKCTPHYGMGMVALIQVGDASNLDAAKAVKQTGKAKKRFEAIFAEVK